ncbi:MAG: S8 family serine peptidase, partial [Actinomycetota bacterium]
SMASPHVAGAAALLLELAPSLAPADVARLLTTAASRNVITDIGTGSPSLLLYIGSAGQSGATTPSTEAPTTTTSTTPQVPETTAPTTTTPVACGCAVSSAPVPLARN